MLDAVSRSLLTSYGLRSLSPRTPPIEGTTGAIKSGAMVPITKGRSGAGCWARMLKRAIV